MILKRDPEDQKASWTCGWNGKKKNMTKNKKKYLLSSKDSVSVGVERESFTCSSPVWC